MKLRTQFLVLVGGIIAVPFLVSTFMLFEQFYVARGREPLPNYPQIMSWIGRKVPRAIRHHELAALGEGRPPGLDIVIFDRDDVISSSTIPELPPGTPATSALLMQYIRAHIDQFHFQLETSHAPGNDDSLLILKLPKIRPGRGALQDPGIGAGDLPHDCAPGLLFPDELSHPALAEPVHPHSRRGHAADRGWGS